LRSTLFLRRNNQNRWQFFCFQYVYIAVKFFLPYCCSGIPVCKHLTKTTCALLFVKSQVGVTLKIAANEKDTNDMLQTLRTYRNVCNMSFVSVSLAVIFSVRLFSASAFRVRKSEANETSCWANICSDSSLFIAQPSNLFLLQETSWCQIKKKTVAWFLWSPIFSDKSCMSEIPLCNDCDLCLATNLRPQSCRLFQVIFRSRWIETLSSNRDVLLVATLSCLLLIGGFATGCSLQFTRKSHWA